LKYVLSLFWTRRTPKVRDDYTSTCQEGIIEQVIVGYSTQPAAYALFAKSLSSPSRVFSASRLGPMRTSANAIGFPEALTTTGKYDYYAFCASATFNPRAFDDFGYDACVLIHDWERLIELVKVQPVPARGVSAGSVVYLDPYMPHRGAPSVHLAKHFRCGYQMEWRIFWTDPIPPPPLQPYFVELGNLGPFCDLITL
jgi:hypothetical protein